MKVSIITATYNCEESVADAIDSVLSQTYENIEYVIVDGASSDRTIEIIKEKTVGVQQLKFVSEPDTGIYDALNKGIAMATGEVIAFLHADDIYASSCVITDVVNVFLSTNLTNETNCLSKNESSTELQSHQDGLPNTEHGTPNTEHGTRNTEYGTPNTVTIDSVYGDLEYVKKDDVSKVIRYWQSGDCTEKKLKSGWMPPHPTFFVRREVYEKYGVFDTKLRIAADYDFMMRVLYKHTISTAYLPQVLIKMRLGGESNRSLKNIICKSKEDLQAMKNNDMGGVFALLMKNLSKIKQFVVRN